MRSSIIAFALGIVILQCQSVLPQTLVWIGLLSLVIFVLILSGHHYERHYRFPSILACALLGFCWAASMAQLRLADQLPEA